MMRRFQVKRNNHETLLRVHYCMIRGNIWFKYILDKSRVLFNVYAMNGVLVMRVIK